MPDGARAEGVAAAVGLTGDEAATRLAQHGPHQMEGLDAADQARALAAGLGVFTALELEKWRRRS